MNKEILKEKSRGVLGKIKNIIALISNGEFNFSYTLYLWGVIPGVILVLFLQRSINSINNKFILMPILVLVTVYFSWHLISVRKALKVHPEYRVRKESKKELYKDKTPQEIKEIKKEKTKEKVQKLLLLRAWDSTPNYVLVECFDLYIILTQLQVIFTIIGY